ncbi:molecular chaperone [Klebsiella pasteurii]|uniref:fimbrial biogenesis chaperone n=1 Tax=Klebsiella pasteurii TaxID=2587529 RepID=UPI003AB7228A
MTKPLRYLAILAGIVVSFLMSATSYASIIVNGTRVIYPGNEREITVKLSNNGQQPVLVQSWIDNGDVSAKPEKIAVPFILTPPVNRIDPDKGQTLRLSYTASPRLPEDRESVYWLNVLEIPPAKQNIPNRLQMAFRTRIKIFYRPDAIADRSKAIEAAEALKWSIAGGELRVENKSPYYVSLVSISASQGGRKTSIDGEMVPPMNKKSFKLTAGLSLAHGAAISYEYINDWGAVKTVNTVL